MKKTMTLAMVAAAALLVPVAFAAKPAKNSAFQYCESKNSCPFGFETSRDGRKIESIALYNDCNRVPFPKSPTIKVDGSGRFSKTGTVKNVIGETITYSITGRFVKPKKAVGTYRATKRGCREQAVKFTAKRVGSANDQ